MDSKFIVVFIAAFLGSAFANQGVPLLMWKPTGTLPDVADVSKSCAATNDDFKVKVLEGLDKVDNILLFLQDTLGIEDFSKYGKGAFSYLSTTFESDESSHLFLPRVIDASDACQETLGRTRKVSEINEAADGLRVATILKSSPRNLIIIRLKTAGSGRLDSLIEKDALMKKFVASAAERTDKFLAIFTGEKAAVVDFKRVKRQLVGKNLYLHGSCVEISAKSARINQGSKSEVAEETKTTIEIPSQEVNADAETCEESADRSATYMLNTHDTNLSELKLTFDFRADASEWQLAKLTADYKLGAETRSEELVTKQKIQQRKGKPYSAHNPVEFASMDKKISVVFDNISVDPYPMDSAAKQKLRATDPKPASGNVYFSIPVLSGISVTFLLLIITWWGIDNIMAIKVNDQFDDPRGKTITVPQTD